MRQELYKEISWLKVINMNIYYIKFLTKLFSMVKFKLNTILSRKQRKKFQNKYLNESKSYVYLYQIYQIKSLSIPKHFFKKSDGNISKSVNIVFQKIKNFMHMSFHSINIWFSMIFEIKLNDNRL